MMPLYVYQSVFEINGHQMHSLVTNKLSKKSILCPGDSYDCCLISSPRNTNVIENASFPHLK